MNGQPIVYETLDKLGVPYKVIEHEAVYTMEDMERLGLPSHGTLVKNLFLRDAKGKRHFLVVLRQDKQADLRLLERLLEASKLSFASEDRLQKHLGLQKGAVTPLGILNDTAGAVEVAIDKDLVDDPSLGIHPNENTATLFMPFHAVEQVMRHCGRQVKYVQL